MKIKIVLLVLIPLLTACDVIKHAYVTNELKDNFDLSLTENKELIQVVFCGTGSPQKNSERGQACTLIAAGGQLFLFDAGENAMRNLEAANVDSKHLTKAFITHFHSDHFNGLASLVNHTWIYGRTDPFDVYGPTGISQVVEGLTQAYALDAQYRNSHFVSAKSEAFATPHTIEFLVGSVQQRVYSKDGVTIDAWKVAHEPVDPALGYLLSYKGKKVFISGDTKVDNIYKPALINADLVIHEAMAMHLMEQGIDVAKKQGWEDKVVLMDHVMEYHSSTLNIAKNAQEMNVKKVALTHLIPEPNNFIARILFEYGMSDFYDGEVILAEDNMKIKL